jgi:hypothetical protein
MSRIVSFRGLLAHGAQERISLGTIRGQTGYRIIKFQLLTWVAGHSGSETESTVKIYKIEQDIIDSVVNFSDNTLLGAGVLGYDADISIYPPTRIVTFDSEIFNQDIFVTHSNLHTDVAPVNYYLELEQMPLASDEATVATLKDIRNND